MTEKELLHVMQNVNDKYSDEVQKRIDAAQKPVFRRAMPFLLAAGAAACVALTVITALVSPESFTDADSKASFFGSPVIQA